MENEGMRKYMITIPKPEYMRIDPSRLSCLLVKGRWYSSFFFPLNLIGISFSLRRHCLFSIWLYED